MENNQENGVIAACLLVLASVALTVSLIYTKPVMIPFILAIFLSYFFSPAVEFMRKKLNFPRWLAALLGLGGGILILAGLFWILQDSFQKILESITVYENRLDSFSESLTQLAAKYKIAIDHNSIVSFIKQLPIVTFLQNIASSFVSFAMNALLILIFLVFIVSGKSYTAEKTGIYAEIDDKIHRYIITKVTTSIITGILTWIILAIFGVDLALMFAVLAYFLNFIPTLGSIIAVLLPLPIALLQFDSTLRISLIVLIPALFQLLIGNVLEPKMIGKSLDLHPVTIILSLMFWGLVWGLPGMFLAAPITAMLKIILEKITITYNLSEMLAGRIGQQNTRVKK